MTDFQQQRIEALQEQIDLYQSEIDVLKGSVMNYEDRVIRATERFFQVKDLTQKSRHRRLVKARAVAAKVLREDGYSLNEIGTALRREYTTIMHTLKNPIPSPDVAAVRRLID